MFGADLVVVDTISAAFAVKDENSNSEVASKIFKPLLRMARETKAAILAAHHVGKIIGFVEEIPFRGFIFQKFRERLSFWVANLISSLLFSAIHLPGWISLHLLSPETIVFVFFFGMLMVVIFRYSGSLWSTIVSHSLNDFLSAVVFRH
jgi:membrane protease YdiL (CAAX protease family)